MEQSDLLRFVATVMEAMELRYFVTGSTATIFYGEPRFTNDIDISGILKTSHQRIDMLYISKWVSQMNLDDIWALVLAQAAK